MDGSQAGTPVDRTHSSFPPTTFEDIRRHMESMNDEELPTRVVMPAVREEKQRTGSQSSTHSAASSGKGARSKIGAWLRKKRGASVSSSTSLGAQGAVSD